MPGNKKLSPAANGQWIFLFTPRNEPHEISKVGNQDVKIGRLEVDKLVDLGKHDYKLEPNVSFTPDGKWIVFRSNLHGPTHVYAVEVKKSKSALGN
jgi:oligogalacturonide lyase